MREAFVVIPPELFAPAESSRFEGELHLDSLETGADTYTFDGPLVWQADVTNTGDAFLVMGAVKARAKTACARCLEDVAVSLEGEIEGYFLVGESEEEPEDMEGDEFDVLPENNTIDLVPLICAALLMEVPLLPLCDEGCRGLCLSCGKNLNEGLCACEPASNEGVSDEPGDSHPFAALKDFKFDT